ncbi:MAG TPA: hemerythrin domain-containing protein [Gemmataceae bacterium]
MIIPSLNDFLTEDHNRLDEFLESFQERKAGNFIEAAEFWMRFASALKRHLLWEETILFPLFEQKTGQSGLTDTLRAEHEEIREWLAALDEKVHQKDINSDHEVDRLVNELGGHNAREEYALYPQLDKLLSEVEKQAAFEAMSAVPEAAP